MSYDITNISSSLLAETFNPIEDFQKAISERNSHADDIIDNAIDIIQGAGIIEKYRESKKGPQFIVDLTDELKQAIRNNEIKLDKNAKGELFAQIREKGKYGAKLPIKEVPGVVLDPISLANALQMQAIDEKLDNIVNLLAEIGVGVDSVREGQQNDRIGLYCSGVNLYLEAVKLSENSPLKPFVLAQSLKTLSDATAQEVQQIQADIKFITNGQHLNLKKGATKELDIRMKYINDCFDIIHKASILRAKIYYDCNELQALITVFSEYQAFLDNVIVKNKDKLAEYDCRDTKLIGGIWESKSLIAKNIEDVKNTLTNNGESRIEIKEHQ